MSSRSARAARAEHAPDAQGARREPKALRWFIAICAVSAFIVLGFIVSLIAMWGQRGSWGFRRFPAELTAPWLCASLPVAVAAFPALADRIVGSRFKWIVAPFVLVALTLCVALIYDATMRGFFDEHVPAIVLPTLPCALYLSWRVLLPRRPTTP